MPWWQVGLFNLAALLAFALSLALLLDRPKGQAAASVATDKRIAISFDDSPRGPGALLNVTSRPEMLLAQLDEAMILPR
jgi:peptidoglycan-N-acetylglucosamine deacetylase